jgi:hypothetical protein
MNKKQRKTCRNLLKAGVSLEIVAGVADAFCKSKTEFYKEFIALCDVGLAYNKSKEIPFNIILRPARGTNTPDYYFIEIEDDYGVSMRVGTWEIDEENEHWAIRISEMPKVDYPR